MQKRPSIISSIIRILSASLALIAISLSLLGCSQSVSVASTEESWISLKKNDHWKSLRTSAGKPPPEEYRDILFTDQKHGWLLAWSDPEVISGSFGTFGYGYSNSILFRTTDGGITWESSFKSDNLRLSFVFLNNNIGWLSYLKNGRYTIARTFDGGLSWIENKPKYNTPSQICPISRNEAWGVRLGGKLLHTKDGGASWQRVHLPAKYGTYYMAIYFRDKKHGWLLVDSNKSKILMTEDGGKTFQSTKIDNSILFPGHSLIDPTTFRMHFLNQYEGWVCSNNVILHTIDGGRNWTNISGDLSRYVEGISELNDFSFLNRKKGWIAGNNGFEPLLLHTTNAGKKAIPQNVGTVDMWGNLSRICFVDEQHGWLIGTVRKPKNPLDRKGKHQHGQMLSFVLKYVP